MASRLLTIRLLAAAGLAFVVASSCGAQIAFRNPSVELGELLQNERRTLVLRLVHAGGAALKVDKVVVDCGCLKVGKAPAAVGPGGAELRLELDTGNLTGTQRKQVAVVYEKGRLKAVADIRFVVRPDLELQPPDLHLGVLRPGQKATRTILVRARPGIEPRVSVARATGGIRPVLLDRGRLEGRKTWHLQLVFAVPDKARPGQISGAVFLDVQGARVKRVTLSYRVLIETTLVVRPWQADFGRVAPSAEGLCPVTVTSRDNRPFRIKGALEDGIVFADFDDTLTASRHRVVLQLPKGQQPGTKRGRIRLLTDHPEVPLIEIFYKARVERKKP